MMLQTIDTRSAESATDGISSVYGAMAADYDASYGRPSHRKLYDQMAWEHITALGLPSGARIIDAGCGTGRWARKWLDMGHHVTAIERSGGMLEALRAQGLERHGERFELLVGSMTDVVIAPGSADLVLAMGSVQYVADPKAMIARMASWLKPGGSLFVYVDSLMALVMELLREGRQTEAMERLTTRRGVLRQGDHEAALYLYDTKTLIADMADAGLSDVFARGLAVTAGVLGRQACTKAMLADEEQTLATERVLGGFDLLTDTGLHILGSGRRP